ncbi:MAG: hypothetical protein MK066_11295, partial [Crocinitomicaceae bacterium]|nr:hypothetical protein [Crocinitomicaceae bacterium]
MYKAIASENKFGQDKVKAKSITDIVDPKITKIKAAIEFYEYIRNKYHKEETSGANNEPFFKPSYQMPPMDNGYSNQEIENKANSEYETFKQELNSELKIANRLSVHFNADIFRKLRAGMRVNSDFLKYVAEKNGRLASYPGQLSRTNFIFNVTDHDIDRFFSTKRPSNYEAALMAKHVYDTDDVRPLQGGWRISRREFQGVIFMQDSIGFQSRLYEKVDDTGHVIA